MAAGTDRTRIYDFFQENKALLWMGGFAQKRDGPYRYFIIFLYVFHAYIQTMCFFGCYMGAARTDLVLGSLHVWLISIFAVWGITTRIVTDRSLNRTHEMVVSGIYTYEDEEDDKEITAMRETVQAEVKKKSNAFLMIFFVGALSNMVYYPITQLIFLPPDYDSGFANPYLAHVYYYPFNTRTPLGFCVAYFSNVCLMIFIYGVACCMNEIYISLMVQLRIHLKMLNHSIRSIHERAYRMFVKDHGVATHLSLRDLCETKAFQQYLYLCLRSNIQHHQALLRFKKESKAFNGSIVLCTITLASIIYASMVYVMYQKPPIHIMINYAMTVLVEQTYALYMCMSGEEIIQESSQVFESLYAIQWMDYGKSFNQDLLTMMCNTMRPIEIKALLLSFTTSLHTYSDLYSAMYKMMNVWRQSEKEKRD